MPAPSATPHAPRAGAASRPAPSASLACTTPAPRTGRSPSAGTSPRFGCPIPGPMAPIVPGSRQGPGRGSGTAPPRPRRRARAGVSARLECVLTQSPASISALVGRDRRPPGRCLARLEAIEVLGIFPSASFGVRPEGPCEPVAFAIEQRDFPSLCNPGHSLLPRKFPIRLPESRARHASVVSASVALDEDCGRRFRTSPVREASSLGRHHGVSARVARAVPGLGDGSGSVAGPAAGPVVGRADADRRRAQGTIITRRGSRRPRPAASGRGPRDGPIRRRDDPPDLGAGGPGYALRGGPSTLGCVFVSAVSAAYSSPWIGGEGCPASPTPSKEAMAWAGCRGRSPS
jgi:hypothetical protein